MEYCFQQTYDISETGLKQCSNFRRNEQNFENIIFTEKRHVSSPESDVLETLLNAISWMVFILRWQLNDCKESSEWIKLL